MARDLLDESSSDDRSSSDEEQIDLKINQDFAKRFEHNKKREELQKLEEKHGKQSKKRKRDAEDGSESVSDEDTSSDSEDEDDAGELATTTLDSEIMATLNAIRSKDPRLYDGQTTFYTAAEVAEQPSQEKAEKPLYLRDYHRQNLLNVTEVGDEDEPVTYDQEQTQLKKSIIDEMHAAADDSDDDELLVAKRREKPIEPPSELDVENAERDPETFLSNFMASRAWVPTEKSAWQPLESDDEEDERRAEAFEEAYNLRFEDPQKSNETLRTHARDMAAKYSVRRDEKNARKKKREAEKERKEFERQQLKQEKARLRKLKIEEVEEKVRKIKKAAGLKPGGIQPEDWARFVDEDWDDAHWEEEMQKRFGEEYYAEQDIPSEQDEKSDKKAKLRKPKFDDDIDINDIIPDFREEEADFSLTEDEQTTKNNHKKLKEEKKRESKRERRIIEQLVDDQLQFELDSAVPGRANGFRYRETSPQSFGLNSKDILLADDTQLNQFAGLKKLASFRDAEKKRKDKKHLGKKARLRQWRKETFGDEEGLQDADLVPSSKPSIVVDDDDNDDDADGGVNIRTTGKKKRRRGKKQKQAV